MKNIYLLMFVALLLLQDNNSGNSDPQRNDSPQPIANKAILLNNSLFCNIWTDFNGMSIYIFYLNTKDTSKCLGVGLDLWPVFFSENITIDEGNDTNGIIFLVPGVWPISNVGFPHDTITEVSIINNLLI